MVGWQTLGMAGRRAECDLAVLRVAVLLLKDHHRGVPQGLCDRASALVRVEVWDTYIRLLMLVVVVLSLPRMSPAICREPDATLHRFTAVLPDLSYFATNTTLSPRRGALPAAHRSTPE